jgi:hypothetical protein
MRENNISKYWRGGESLFEHTWDVINSMPRYVVCGRRGIQMEEEEYTSSLIDLQTLIHVNFVKNHQLKKNKTFYAHIE